MLPMKILFIIIFICLWPAISPGLCCCSSLFSVCVTANGPGPGKRSDPVHLYSFLTIALIFVFYCIPASKRSVYLLPIYPFIGYFLAVYFLWLVRMGKTAIKIFAIVISCLIILLTVVFFVSALKVSPFLIIKFVKLTSISNVAISPFSKLMVELET